MFQGSGVEFAYSCGIDQVRSFVDDQQLLGRNAFVRKVLEAQQHIK